MKCFALALLRDGKPLGQLNQSYSFFRLDPGERHVRAVLHLDEWTLFCLAFA
jgi:hypothetical protein